MIIAVNTRLLLPGKLEGIGWFTHETLSRIVRAHPEHRFLFLFDRKFDTRFIYGPNVQGVVVPPPTRHPLLYRIWFQWMLPRVLKKHKADLFLSPDGFLSLRTPVPQLPVIHDLNFEHYPADLPKAYSDYYRHWFPRFAQKAVRIATVSQYSKDDIATRYNVPPERIDVVHNGVGDVFAPLTAEQKLSARQRWAEGANYFICVGSLHPRKNIGNLLKAFDQVATHDRDVRLVIVGESFWWDARMKSAWEGLQHKERVVFTGRLEQNDLREALGGALALAFVSYFEGFGIPVAEAMRCGVPVVAANATSLPEVAGEAAVYCDPFDTADIARALDEVRGDADLRAQLIIAGIERAKQFTWDRAAERLWACVQRALG
ncbi:MAG TPA: glycosyltransferase family 1 protein [Flavobacteriales bacterium]|jgi:glycosyltransferase involved in cell wall biosynthesis|nr:glycosyltransferase family 1 protein [Flavobacteriales bacterium]